MNREKFLAIIQEYMKIMKNHTKRVPGPKVNTVTTRNHKQVSETNCWVKYWVTD